MIDIIESLDEFEAYIQKCDVKFTRNNNSRYAYLKLIIAGDNPLRINGKKWNIDGRDEENLKRGVVLKVNNFSIDSYNGEINIIIKNYEVIPSEEYDLLRFSERSVRDKKDMVKELKEYISTYISNEEIYEVVVNALRGASEKFLKYPAAESYHHVYYCGLLEHTLEVVKICVESAKSMSESVNGIDFEVLVASAILHDLGKIEEYEVDSIGTAVRKKNFEMVGISHSMVARDMVLKISQEVRNRIPDFKWSDKISLVEHCILSHHGKLEWGAIVEPITKEAVILHLADMMSSKVNGLYLLEKNQSIGKFSIY